MTADPAYASDAIRVETFRDLAVAPWDQYLEGYRRAMVRAIREPVDSALPPREPDLHRWARALGEYDGHRWRVPGEQRGLLHLVIHESGLSARRFAVEILTRDERTIRRWLAGDSPIPAAVVARLRRRLAA